LFSNSSLIKNLSASLDSGSKVRVSTISFLRIDLGEQEYHVFFSSLFKVVPSKAAIVLSKETDPPSFTKIF